MNRYLLLVCLLAVGLLDGCTRSSIQTAGDSWVELSTVADPSLNLRSTKADSYTIPLPNDYSYVVRRLSDNGVVAEGASVADMGKLAVMAGNYTFEVTSVGQLSLDKPSYKGSKPFVVQKEQTAQVEVTAKLNSAVVAVNFSQAIKTNFATYKATISAQGVAQTAVFDDTTPEGKLIYLPAPATRVTCTIEVTTFQNVRFETQQVVENLAAADLLVWTVDVPPYVEKPTDPLVVELLLDRTVNEEQKVFSVGLTQTATGVPTITGRQLDVSVPIGVKRGVASDVRLDLSTKAGLAKVLLMFRIGQESLTGRPAQGLIDVLALSDDDKAAWGIELIKEGTTEPGVGATNTLLKLSNMTAKMPGPEKGAQNYYVSIGVLDLNGQYTVRELTFNVYGVSVTTFDYSYDIQQAIDWKGEHGLVNGTYATIRGRYNIDDAPNGMTFRYRDVGQTEWQYVPAQFDPSSSSKEVWAQAGVLPNGQRCEYELFVEEGANFGGAKTFTAFRGPQIENMNFDAWGGSNGNPSGPWSSPNNSLGKNTGSDAGWNGSGSSVKMTTQNIFNNFASGGVFTGSMVVNTTEPYKSSKVGIPFVHRPKKLRGYFKYTSATIGTIANGSLPGNGAVNGQPDMCEIAVKLEDWSDGGDYKERWRDGFFGEPDPMSYLEGRTAKVKNYDGKPGVVDPNIRTKLSVGYGQKTSRGQNSWTPFEIEIEYYQDIQPTHMIITAVSSAWGGYMSGGLGSVLWIDDLELIY